MVWQMDLSRELMGLHDSLDDHVDPEEAAFQLIQLAGSLRASTTLAGEDIEKGPNVSVANAAEFAFIWNVATPEQRDNITAVIMARQDEAIKCFMEDHDGLKEQLEGASRRIAELTEQIAKVQQYANDRKAQARSQNNTLSSWRVWSDLAGILGTHPASARFTTEYGHPDCEICEDLAELAIQYLQAAGNEKVTRRHVSMNGHWGRAGRD